MSITRGIRHTLLNKDDEARLLERAGLGDLKAIAELVECNQGLVRRIAAHYSRYDDNMDDLIQWGNLGMLRAIARWDGRKTNRFSTYAYYWIKRYVIRYGLRDNPCSISYSAAARLNRIRAVRSSLLLALRREPTTREIADETAIPLNAVELLYPLLAVPVSLDALPNETDEDCSVYTLRSRDDDPQDAAERSDTMRQIIAAIQLLPAREQTVLAWRYLGDESETLRQVAARMGLSTERVRQIEAASLETVRQMLRRKEADVSP